VKNITKKFGIIAMAALIAFAMAACDTDNGGNNNDGPTHFPGTLIAEDLQNSRQVWEYKREWTKISDAHISFDGNRDVNVFVRMYDADSKLLGEKNVGSGKIEDGILSFSITIPKTEDLIGWDALKSKNFFYWEDAAVVPPGVKGNEFMFVTTPQNERLNLEIITGTREELSQELVRFIYVDKNCKMTGTKGVEGGFIPGVGAQTPTFFETDHALNLSLKEGWNTVYRRQTFRTGEDGDGKSLITMEIKNPLNLRWILYPAGYDGVSRPQ